MHNANMKNPPDWLMKMDAELFTRIEEIVHFKWDPIGISGIPEARDEYSGYVNGIYSKLLSDDDSGLIK